MLPNIGHRTHAKVNDALRITTLRTWQKAVAFFNQVSNVAEHLPLKDPHGIKGKMHTAALEVADIISRAAYVMSKEEYELCLKQAEEAVYETVSSMYIAHQWGLVTQNMYEHIYAEGGQLTEALLELSSQSNHSAGQLN